MAAQSEAACLVQTGALYARRIGLGTAEGGLVFVGRKRGAFSIYVDDEPIYHFDLEGRWQRVYREGLHFKKALDGTVVEISRPRVGANMVLRRRRLSYAEATDLDDTVRGEAIGLIDRVASGRASMVAPPAPGQPLSLAEVTDLLDRVSRWDADAWFRDRERFLGTYGPIGFLPPDGLNSIVLQATLGSGECGAFSAASSSPRYVRSLAEFETHAREVAALWGLRALQSQGVFLACGDVLSLPDHESYFDAVARVFSIGREQSDATARGRGLDDKRPCLARIDVFVDSLPAALPGPEGWHRLKDRFLGRVTLGVESGSSDIRALYGKSYRDEDLTDFVQSAKQAGIDLGVVVLVGAGGEAYSADHVSRTAALLTSMPLGRADFVYLVGAAEVDPQSGDGRAFAAMDAEGVERQTDALKTALAPLRTGRGVKVVPYTTEKQGL